MNLKLSLFVLSAILVIGVVPLGFAEETKLTASDGGAYDYFGNSVSISDDTAIVGATGDGDNGSNSGSAYIFTLSNGTWSQTQKLTASDGTTLDVFGDSVSISDDTAIVGATGDSSGSAYIFNLSGGTWSQTQKLTASDGTTNDHFGNSVSISDDTAIVGAYRDDDSGSNSGSAYIFTLSNGTWSQTQKLTVSDGEAYDYFGISVSISGDTAIVGAYWDDDSGVASGSSYIFSYNGTGWEQTQKLTASDGEAYDSFGNSVSISDDTAIVGATGDGDNGDSSGSAYIFNLSGGTWSQTQKLTASDGTTNDSFGNSVSISDDTAIVGAYWDAVSGTNSSSAYIFSYNGTGWEQTQKLIPSDGEAYDYFGISVSISGDTAIVGAPYNDDNGDDSGSAYVFTGNIIPDAPTSLSAIVSEGSITLSWDALTYDWPEIITDYQIEYSDDSGSSWTVYSDGTSTETSATVSGLENDVTYDFRVSATNMFGTGVPSTSVSATLGVSFEDQLAALTSLVSELQNKVTALENETLVFYALYGDTKTIGPASEKTANVSCNAGDIAVASGQVLSGNNFHRLSLMLSESDGERWKYIVHNSGNNAVNFTPTVLCLES